MVLINLFYQYQKMVMVKDLLILITELRIEEERELLELLTLQEMEIYQHH